MRGYDTVEYAKSRLSETIITHQGQPYFVSQVGGTNDKIIVVLTSLVEDKIITANLDECDINPVRLGYVNHKLMSYYIMRAPMRKDWRQGLRMMNIITPDGENPRAIGWKSIAETIMGKYPKYHDAITQVSKPASIKKMAFSRDFSINRIGEIEYKGMFPIGSVNMENGNVLIHDNMNWVADAFNETMENAA